MNDEENVEDDLSWMDECSLIPAKGSDKRPAIPTWKQYQSQRPTPEEMEKWRSELRPSAWALICGKVSGGIYVVDVDSVLATQTVIGRWARYLGPTKTVVTSGMTPGEPLTGKRHFYFKDANVGKTISWTPRARQLDDARVPPVDLKGEAGYVISPGSKHPSGAIYSVVDDSPIKDVPYERVRHVLETIFRHWPLLDAILPSYETGSRTFWCGNLAAYAYHRGFSEQDALILVRTLAYGAVDPLSTEADVSNAEQAVRSTYQRAQNGVAVGYKGDGGPQGAGWPEELVASIDRLPEKVRFPKGAAEVATEEMRKRFGLEEKEVGEEEKVVDAPIPEVDAEEDIEINVAAKPETKPKKTKAVAELDDDEKINTTKLAQAIQQELNVIGVWNNGDFVGHFMYHNGVYVRAKQNIKAAARDALGDKGRNYHIAEVLGYLETAEMHELTEFDKEEGKLCLENGILDVGSRTLEEWSPERYFMKKLPVEFHPEAQCPRIDAYFEAWSPTNKQALYEIIAHTLVTWEYPIQSVVILVGSGANGKSTYLLMITHFLGEENVSAIEMQAFGENRFSSAKLLGKFANVCSDMDKRRIKSTAEFKKLTGGDPIQGEIKHGALFTFFNNAKMLFSLNELPQSPDDTDAFHRRVYKMKFDNKFQGKKKKRQSEIMKDCKDEFSGLLNGCLNVLPGLLERLAFNGDSDDVDVKREMYHRESRPVYGFWEDRLTFQEVDDNGQEVTTGIIKNDLYRGFRDYRGELSVLSYDGFFKKLREEFINRNLEMKTVNPRGPDGKQKPSIVGLRFKAGFDQNPKVNHQGQSKGENSLQPHADRPYVSQLSTTESSPAETPKGEGPKEGEEGEKEVSRKEVVEPKVNQPDQPQKTLEQAEPALKPVIDATEAVQAKIRKSKLIRTDEDLKTYREGSP
jgi:putative DNA primase/helicase